MRTTRMLALGASLLVLLSACSTGGGSKPTIKIGSDGFDEARIMAEVYAQALEAKGYNVDRAGIGLGTRDATNAALWNGQIDMKPEYVGSGLSKLGGAPTSDPAKNQAALQTAESAKGITVLGFTPGQDTNALVVRKETADQFHLTKWSDLTAVATQLKWGLATDCPTNPVCSAALKNSYGIDTTKLQVTLLDACSSAMDDALTNKTVDVAELCSTGPEIIVNGWVRLEDDKTTQPADAIAPVVRNDYLAKVDKAAFQAILDAVSAKIDTSTLAELYKEVSVDKKDLKTVAAAWLQANGFTQGTPASS
ncbi:MAG TPA: glycine betaine ABC transporter substrate-binding protein [Candidatus Dormibacteraeota bacterium]|nr:glycine betaine ABC transporter substrate-binding protein [Candidatus Dormibacteraeota bacterium]